MATSIDNFFIVTIQNIVYKELHLILSGNPLKIKHQISGIYL